MSDAPGCECEGPGPCPRYGRDMSNRLWELCSGRCPPERPCPDDVRAKYRASWSRGQRPTGTVVVGAARPAGKVQTLDIRPRPIPRYQYPPGVDGPGTVLTKRIAELGLGNSGCASCRDAAERMDRYGPEWCRANRKEIVSSLRTSQQRLGWREYLTAAGNAVRLAAGGAGLVDPTDPAGWLFDWAVSACEESLRGAR